jgi:regulator of sirC expression with transglutaminase-like and TPR domain
MSNPVAPGPTTMPLPDFSVDAEFQKLICGRCDVDLVQWLLELAADRYPSLDRLGCLLELDRLGVACSAQPAFNDPMSSVADKLAAVSYVLYEVEGFHGDRDDYYDPRNSYLNEVLTRRAGLPISLSIIYMAVAARAGLRLYGVNVPGHFVVGCPTARRPIFVDAFSGGELMNQEACKRRIERMLGKPGALSSEHFRPAAPRDIAVRVLRNLKSALARKEDWPAVLAVQLRLTSLEPHSAEERRDLGLLLLRSGQPHQALALLEPSLASADCQQVAALKGAIRAARKMAAEMN